MQRAALFLMILGLLAAWVLATETRLLFFWPGAALLGLSGLLVVLKWRYRVLFSPSDACLLSVSLLTLYLGVRAWSSPVAAWAREDAVLLAAAWVVYLLVATLWSHPRRRVLLLVLLLAVALGNLVVGFIHFSGRWDFHVVPEFARTTGAGRIGGFFPNPNHLGAFFSMALFLSAGWVCHGRAAVGWKLLCAFLVVAFATGCALTLSRGALAGLAVGVVVFALLELVLIWRTRRQLFSLLLSGGLLAVLTGGVVLWKVNEEQLRTRELRSPVSADIRAGVWQSALAQHAESPWLGAGARMFYQGSIRLRSPELPVTAADPLFAHGEYLQLLADYGWLGLALLLPVLLAHGWSALAFLRWFARHKYAQTGQLSGVTLALTLGAVAALAATAAHAVVEFHFHVPATVLTAAALLGILANPGLDSPAHAPRRLPGVRFGSKLLLAAAAAVLLAATWLHALADYHLARAMLAQAQGDRPSALTALERAVALDPANPSAHYQLGLAILDGITARTRQESRVELENATGHLRRAIELNPARHLHYLALADAQDALGQHEAALQAIQAALALAPLHEEPRLALGIHWHRLGDLRQAENAYLWASEARAWNTDGSTRWVESYRLLLQHATLLRRPAR